MEASSHGLDQRQGGRCDAQGGGVHEFHPRPLDYHEDFALFRRQGRSVLARAAETFTAVIISRAKRRDMVAIARARDGETITVRARRWRFETVGSGVLRHGARPAF